MRLSVAAVALVATTSVSAFAFTAFSPRTRRATFTSASSSSSSSSNNNNGNNKDLHEFDFLLREQTAAQQTEITDQTQQSQQQQQQQTQHSGSRRGIALGGNSEGQSVILASSFAGAPNQVQESQSQQEETTDPDDPYANSLDDDALQLNKIQNFQEQQVSGQNSFESRLKQMDLQDIIATIILPSIVVFAGARWGFNKVSVKVKDTAKQTLDNFAKEMMYHDGDFDEMKMAVADYSKRLVWMGPAKKDLMLKKYLEVYAKKKTVSPKSISSLSYAFSLFKLSEEQAAAVLVSLCRQMGTDKISSAGKLLFLGSRILKSKEGKAALQPIKELIKSTYREEAVAETMMETSQQAMAEASYRATILAAGKNQKKLTVGWEVLGVDREIAQRMFDEEAKEGFISEREKMYGGQKRKYDKKGNQINEEGKLEDPENAIPDDDDAGSAEPVSNVHECGQCGFTIFVAQGREDKFFGSSFVCPECGAGKDQFKAGGDDDEE